MPSIDSINPNGFKVCLINSDFQTGMTINRDKLDKIIHRVYGTFCSFEPCIYPAVKIQYFYNESCGDKNGICNCSRPCCGKGSGSGDSQCKKITIAGFGSGCVIITGSQSLKQLDTAYGFICNVLKKHYDDIKLQHANILVP